MKAKRMIREKEIAERIKGMQLIDVAKGSGVNYQRIQRYSLGTTESLRLCDAEKISDYFDELDRQALEVMSERVKKQSEVI